MAAAGEVPKAVELVEVGADDSRCSGGDLGRVGLHFGDWLGQIETLREVVRGIVDGRLIFVAQAEVHGQPAIHFPVVLDEHAVKFHMRVRSGTADHL
jgi:hypothetical protein